MEMYIETMNNSETPGIWISLDFKTFDEIQEEINTFLEEHDVDTYQVLDYDDMLNFGLHPDINDIAEYIELCELHGKDVTEAAIIIGTQPENFINEFVDAGEFARHYAEETGLFENASDTLMQFFDFDRFGTYLLDNFVDEHNGFYFYK